MSNHVYLREISLYDRALKLSLPSVLKLKSAGIKAPFSRIPSVKSLMWKGSLAFVAIVAPLLSFHYAWSSLLGSPPPSGCSFLRLQFLELI